MEIIICILLGLLILIGIIILIIQLKGKKGSSAPENVDRLVEKTVQSVMREETVKLTKDFGENNQKSLQNLARFQGNMQEFLQSRIDALNKQLDDKIAALDKKVDDKLQKGFQGTTESMAQVRERLQAIDAAQKQMEDLGKDVVSLRGILEGNQTRGQYGEYQLQMVLHNVFGDTIGCYEEQYTMKKVKDGDDVRADAVVFMPEPNKMICIDSKFPFKDYERCLNAENDAEKEALTKEFGNAVKKHITAIKEKYIVENKTAPEALMFIPNDGVFGFVHQNLQDVVEYAREKRVILTSPSTLPAILVTINMVRIDAERAKNAKEISKQLGRLGKDFEMFAREWDTLSRNIDLAAKNREKIDSRVNRITSKFDSIQSSDLIEAKDDFVEEIGEAE